jgi:hypothetical protein
MKIMVIEVPSFVPGNSTWTAYRPTDQLNANAVKLTYNKVVEVPDKEGEELLKRCADALDLQFTLRRLYYQNEFKEGNHEQSQER